MNQNDTFFSIICCTYNPDREVFSRVLRALINLDEAGISCEYIVIDNNSNVNFQGFDQWDEFLSRPSTMVVREEKPGLTHARIAGYLNSKGQYLIFVDDDNELSPSYLRNTIAIIEKSPMVGAFSPGKIEVEFFGRYPKKYESYLRHIFQERHVLGVHYTNCPNSHETAVFGSGMIVKRELFARYFNHVVNGEMSAIDRVGEKLTSSGDSQIVATVLAGDQLVAVSPDIALRHLIVERKSNLGYVRRLLYTISRYGLTSEIEIHKIRGFVNREVVLPSLGEVVVFLFLAVVNSAIKRDFALISINIATYAGSIESKYSHLDKKVPIWIKAIKFLFGLRD